MEIIIMIIRAVIVFGLLFRNRIIIIFLRPSRAYRIYLNANKTRAVLFFFSILYNLLARCAIARPKEK